MKMEIGRGLLGGSMEYSEGNGGESVVAIPRFLCGSPHLCRLRTEGLVPVSNYWMYRSHASDMGLVSLVVCHQQVLGLSALLQWLCWERNLGRAVDHLAGLRGGIGCTFSQEQCICPTLLTSHERLPRMGTVRRKRTSGIRGLAWEAYVSCWSGFPLQGVHRFESPRLSYMSNRLFVVVIK
jgi:hypothetical protein